MNKQEPKRIEEIEEKVNRIEDKYYSLDFHDVFDAPRVAIGFVGNVPDDFESSGINLSDDATELFGNNLENATVYLDDNFPSLYRNSNINYELPKYGSSRLMSLENKVINLIIANKDGETTIPVKIIATYYREISNSKRITLIVEKAETINSNHIEKNQSNNGGEPLRKSRRSRKSRKARKSKKSKKSGKKSRRNSRR